MDHFHIVPIFNYTLAFPLVHFYHPSFLTYDPIAGETYLQKTRDGSKNENAYSLTTGDELFSTNSPVSIDTRVTLHRGRVKFNSDGTDAEIECGLQSGNVVMIKAMPLQ